MIAIDTNVVVRYLTGDHPEQSARAKALIEREDIFVPVTVVLECDWVLRSAYGYDKADVVRALRAFAGLPTVSVEDPGRVSEAMDRAMSGMDFTDALHLAGSDRCTGLATFDQRFIKAALAVGIQSVQAP